MAPSGWRSAQRAMPPSYRISSSPKSLRVSRPRASSGRAGARRTLGTSLWNRASSRQPTKPFAARSPTSGVRESRGQPRRRAQTSERAAPPANERRHCVRGGVGGCSLSASVLYLLKRKNTKDLSTNPGSYIEHEAQSSKMSSQRVLHSLSSASIRRRILRYCLRESSNFLAGDGEGVGSVSTSPGTDASPF